MSLGAYLRGIREERGWTQKDIANRVNDYLNTDHVDQGRISYWERDQQKAPSADHLRMLAAVYRAPMVEVLIAAGFLTKHDIEVRLADYFSELPPDVRAFEELSALLDRWHTEMDELERRLEQARGGDVDSNRVYMPG